MRKVIVAENNALREGGVKKGGENGVGMKRYSQSA
jgi:hypothetical protein